MVGLSGTTAFVTGAASGLGNEIARVLAEERVHVIAADVRGDGAEELASSLRDRGLSAEGVQLDVRDERQARRVIDEAVEKHGALDALVNNAGVDVTVPFDELSVEDFDRVLQINLRGAFVLSRFAYPHMKQRGSGHIVNVASTAAKRAWPNASAYHASKWGLLGMSHALHSEAREHGVKVTALVAGGMRTPFILERFPDTDPCLLQDPRNVAQAVRFVLLQPTETVVPELTVLPMRETSWP